MKEEIICVWEKVTGREGKDDPKLESKLWKISQRNEAGEKKCVCDYNNPREIFWNKRFLKIE